MKNLVQVNLSHLVAFFNGLVNIVGFGRKKRGMKDLLELEKIPYTQPVCFCLSTLKSHNLLSECVRELK